MLEFMLSGGKSPPPSITADVIGTAYPGQPINYTITPTGIAKNTTVYWSLYENITTSTAGTDRLYDGIVTGSFKNTGAAVVISKRVMGKTLQGRKLVMRIALTAATANNDETALMVSETITIGKSPSGVNSSSFRIPANVYALTVNLSGAGGGGSGGSKSNAFRSYTGGRGGNGTTYYGVVYVTPGTTVSLSVGSGGTGGAIATRGLDGGGTSLSNLVLPAASVYASGGGGGSIGDDYTGATGMIGSPNGSGGSGGAGGSRNTKGSNGSSGSGSFSWGL